MKQSRDPFMQIHDDLQRTISSVGSGGNRPSKLTNYDSVVASKDVYERLTSPVYYTGTAHEIFKREDPEERRQMNIELSHEELRGSKLTDLKDFVRCEQRARPASGVHRENKSDGVYDRLSNPASFTGASKAKFSGSKLSDAQKAALAKKELPLTTDLSSVIARKERFNDSFKPVLRNSGFTETEVKRKEMQVAISTEESGLLLSNRPEAPAREREIPHAASRNSNNRPDDPDIFYRLCLPEGYTGTRFIKFNKEFDMGVDDFNQDLAVERFQKNLRQ